MEKIQNEIRNLNEIPFIFIVGRPRSGTTLLMALFDAHPNVNIPPECQFIVNLYPKYKNIVHWTESKIDEFIEDLRIQWRFDIWKVDLKELKNDLLKFNGKASYSDICKSVYLINKSVFPKDTISLLGDKNHGYTIYTERLLKIFPNARFIHIIRDYRDNLVSIRDVDFELPITSTVVYKWTYFIKRFNKAKNKFPASHYVVKYEDLVTSPDTEFMKICDFAGIDYNEKVFNFHEKTEEALEAYPAEIMNKYFSSLLKKINTSRIGLWKKSLTKGQIKIADLTAGKFADMMGYDKFYNGNNILIWLQALPGILFARFIYLATFIVDRFPYKLRMNILSIWPLALATIFLRIFRPEKYRELQERILKK